MERVNVWFVFSRRFLKFGVFNVLCFWLRVWCCCVLLVDYWCDYELFWWCCWVFWVVLLVFCCVLVDRLCVCWCWYWGLINWWDCFCEFGGLCWVWLVWLFFSRKLVVMMILWWDVCWLFFFWLLVLDLWSFWYWW